jgi:hypothetical protein
VDLCHVAQVENPSLRANGLMLSDHPGVLDWHLPSGEINHSGSKRQMLGVERGAAARQAMSSE